MARLVIKRYFIIFFILLGNVIPSLGQPLQEDFFIYKDYDLVLFKHNVKKIEIEAYTERNGKIEPNSLGGDTYDINPFEKTIMMNNSVMHYWREKEYNDNNLLVSYNTEFLNHNYYYNKKNKLLQEVITNNKGELKRKYIYKYNQKGRVEERLHYKKNDSLKQKMIYFYENDTLVKSIGNPVSKKYQNNYIQYNYDKKGNITEIWVNDILIRKYYYNELGYKIKGEWFDILTRDLIIVDEFFYNDIDLLKKTTHTEHGKYIYIDYYNYFYY